MAKLLKVLVWPSLFFYLNPVKSLCYSSSQHWVEGHVITLSADKLRQRKARNQFKHIILKSSFLLQRAFLFPAVKLLRYLKFCSCTWTGPFLAVLVHLTRTGLRGMLKHSVAALFCSYCLIVSMLPSIGLPTPTCSLWDSWTKDQEHQAARTRLYHICLACTVLQCNCRWLCDLKHFYVLSCHTIMHATLTFYFSNDRLCYTALIVSDTMSRNIIFTSWSHRSTPWRRLKASCYVVDALRPSQAKPGQVYKVQGHRILFSPV